ncbi:MAG TPA: AsnC family transcriptional regulator [Acidimicrobiia bacterium]|nr:AsnC family transcriptional regulator [Acidimicrobiia bacterium]
MSTRRREIVDEIDRGIIGILQKNGRTPNREIARVLDISEATVRNRVSRLLTEDLINIVAAPTPKAVGLTMSAIIGVSVEMRRLDQVVDTIVDYGEVRYLGISTGQHDIIIEAFFEDQEHMLQFVTKKLGHLEGVLNLETSVILKVAKFSYEWEIPQL